MSRMKKEQAIIIANGKDSGPKDEVFMLLSAKSMRRLALDIIMELHAKGLVEITSNSNYQQEYDYGLITRAFAELSVKNNASRNRYFDNVFQFSGNPDLYLNSDWQVLHEKNSLQSSNKMCFNNLIRMMNNFFSANFVYIKRSNTRHELWGPRVF